MVFSVQRFMPPARMRRISSSGSQASMALPTEVACGASIRPVCPVSTRTAWRASRTATMTIAAPRHLGSETALDQRRQQMMTGRNVEPGAMRQIGQRRFAPGFGDGLEQEQCPVDRLDIVAFALSARTRCNGLYARPRQDSGVHCLFLPAIREMRTVKGVNRISGSGTWISDYEIHASKRGLGGPTSSTMKVRPAGRVPAVFVR